MTVKLVSAGRNMGDTNKELRREITNNIIDGLTVNEISRTKDSIRKSDHFHLDSREIDSLFKVEIQYQRMSKKTVAVVQVHPAASDEALRAGLTQSLMSGNTYLVT